MVLNVVSVMRGKLAKTLFLGFEELDTKAVLGMTGERKVSFFSTEYISRCIRKLCSLCSPWELFGTHCTSLGIKEGRTSSAGE